MDSGNCLEPGDTPRMSWTSISRDETSVFLGYLGVSSIDNWM